MSEYNLPLVSVVIALYNSDRYIEETIDSVLSQSYSNFEVIVVDDCSTDNSLEVVKKVSEGDPRVHLISLDSNSGGPAIPRNRGIDYSKGDYLAFLDADDVWLPSKIKLQLEYMQENEYLFSSTGVMFIDALGGKIRKNKTLSKVKHIFLYKNYKQLLLSNTIALSSVLMRRDFLGERRFNTESNLIAVEDYYLWLELYADSDYRCSYLNDDLVKYRVHDDAISSGYNRQQIRSLYCVTKHLISNNRCDYYSSVLMLFVIFFVKHVKVRLFGWLA